MAKLEVWKDIPGYEGLYQVSDLGSIKTFNYLGHGKEKVIKSSLGSNGYNNIVLYKNGKRKLFLIHRLVYQSFKGELMKGLVIDHINGIKTQNNLDNLQQISARENIAKGYTI
jgi:hypothetical protein